ncbi:MAG: M43 family zinc metalloprotease [Bacteroidota bacterium]
MKKILFFTKLVLIFSMSFLFSKNALSQSTIPKVITKTNKNICGFDAIHKEKLQNDPVYLQNTIAFEKAVKNFVPNKSVATYKIPVVVHVMETGTALTAITDQQIKDAILNLNQRLRKVAGSLGDGNGVDTEIEYALAVRDPSGNCTNGINRFDMTGNASYMSEGVDRSSGLGISDATLKAQISWNQNLYYNIWLISEIDDNNGGSGTQGYAFFASSHGFANDGTVMLVNAMKNPSGTTLIHELGHSLNLFHTFEGDDPDFLTCPVGNGCGSGIGDCCGDTPPHLQSSSDCVVAPNTCDGGSSSELFIHNYMDYSSDACQNMLTADQRTRMQTAVSVTRATFLESNGNMSLVPVSPSTVDFKSSKTILCGTGQDVIFYDLSSCSPNTFMAETAWTGTSFSWSITNGTDTYTSTDQNPTINFANTGSFDATLTITTPIGTATLTKNDFIVVSSAATAACIPLSDNEGNFTQTVNNVTFNTINNSTSSSTNVAYTDFSCSQNTIVEEGQTYNLSVTIRAGGSGAEDFEAYIDYNNDGDFADAGEQVLTGTTPASSTNTISGNVVIPGTAIQNTILRMRVIGETFGITAGKRTCSTNYDVGDIEDYGVLITSACVAPSITADPSNSTICTNDNTSFSSTASGDATLNFQWFEDNGGGFVSLSDGGIYSGTATGTLTLTGATASMNTYIYRCEVTNGCGTATSNSATLTVNSATIAQGATSNPTACLGSDGSIEITGTGTGDLSYTGTMTGTDIGVILPFATNTFTAGTYDFTFNDGCNSNTITVTLTDPNPVIAQGATSNPTACLATDGSIEITGAGTGDLSYTGTLTGTDVGVTLPYSISIFSAGTYDFTFNDGCISNTISVTLTDPGSPVTPTISTSGPTTFCDGGSVTLTSSSATDNVWSTGETTQSIVAAISGTFSVFVSTAGCNSGTTSEVVTEDAMPVLPTISASGPTTFCNGGSVDLTSSYAVGNVWTTGETTQTITVTTAGSYSVAITNGTCTNNAINEVITVNFGAAIAQGTTTNPTACLSSDGSIEITGAGTGDLSYTGTMTGTDFGVSLPFTSSLFSAGTYDFTFNDGCNSNTVSVTLTDPSGIVISQGTTLNPSACLSADGSIEITGVGTGDLSYTGTTTGTVLGISLPHTISTFTAGTFDFTFNDGCNSNTVSVTLTDPALTIAQGTTSDPSVCLASDGSIEITGTGTGDLSYTGTTSGTEFGVTLPFTSSLFSSGTYDFTFNNGCVSNTITVTLNDPNPTISQGLIFDPSVCAATDGSIEILGSGVGDLTYTGAATGTDGGITLPYTLFNLGSGSYDFTFNNGCTSNTITVTLTDPGAPADPTIIPQSATTFCDGGAVTLMSSSASDNVWSTGETTQSITVSLGGTYSLMLSVAGCNSNTITEIVTVNPVPSTPTIFAAGPTTFCVGGSVNLHASTGTNITWSTGETTQIITAMIGGNYTVTETNGMCSATSIMEIVTVLNGTTIAQGITSNPSTCGGANGSIQITGTGTGDLSYNGTSSGTNIGITLPFTTTSLSAGTYNFTFNDGCNSNTATITLADPGSAATPTISASGSLTFCAGDNVVLTSSSATDNVWSTGETTQSITITASGTYSVFVSTAGCNSASSSEIVVVNSLPAIASANIINPSSCGNSDGSLDITGTGTGDLSWTGTMSGSNMGISLPYPFSGLTAGTYNFTFTENGCTSNTLSISLTDPGAPAAPTIIVGGGTTFCDGGSVILESSSPTDNVWSTGETTNIITVSSTSVVTLILNIAGCSSAAAVENITEVPIPATPTISASGATTFCDGGNVILTSSSPTDNLWSTGETTQSITVTTSGNYDVTVSNFLCSATSLVESVTVNPVETISTGIISDPSQCGLNDGSIEVIGTATGDLSYTGTFTGSATGITLPFSLTGLAGGTYDITFNDACSSNTISVTLIQDLAPAVPTISASGVTTFCDGGTVTLTSSSAVNNLWSTGETAQSIVVSTSGTYTVSVTNGMCTETSSNTVVNVTPLPAVPTITASGSTTFCDGGSVTLTSSSAVDNVWSTGETTQSITVINSDLISVSIITNGCSSVSLDENVTANPVPAVPTISSSGSTDICLGNNVVLTSSSIGNNTWSTGETTDFITVSTAGSYSVTVSNGFCSASSSNTIVNVNSTPTPTPTITVGGATTFCDGGTVTLTSSSATNNTWSTGETTQSITVSTGNNYDVSVNILGCISTSAPETITVNPIPATPIITANGPLTICSGGTLNLTSSSLVDNNWTTGSNSQTISVTSSGLFSVTVTTLGCSASSNPVQVTVNLTPSSPLIMLSGSTTFCTGGNVILTSTVANGITWSTGETTQSISVSNSGTFTVSVVQTGCNATSAPVVVTEHANPVVSIAPYNDVCNIAEPFALTNGIPSGGNYTVNTVSTTTFDPFFANLGINTITYDIIDENGCTGSATGSINVNNCVEIEENLSYDFVLYPNPTNSTIFIKGDFVNEIKTIEIQDELGRLVKIQELNIGNSIDLSELADGLYNLVLKGDNFEKIERVQVIK